MESKKISQNINNVLLGKDYAIRIRAVSPLGVKSDWSDIYEIQTNPSDDDPFEGLVTQPEISNFVSSSDVHEIVYITQSAYDALTTPDPNILYLVVD